MTVGELIEELQKHSPLLEVLRADDEWGPMEVFGTFFDAAKMHVVVR